MLPRSTFRRRAGQLAALLASFAALTPKPVLGADGQLDPAFSANGWEVQTLGSLDGPYPRTLAAARGSKAYTVGQRTELDGSLSLRLHSFLDDPGTGSDFGFLGFPPTPPPPLAALAAIATAETPDSEAWVTLVDLQRVGEPAYLGLLHDPAPGAADYNDHIAPVMDPAATQEGAGLVIVREDPGTGPESRYVTASNETATGGRWAVLRRFGNAFGEVPSARPWPNGQGHIAFPDAQATGVTADGSGRILVFGRLGDLAWIARRLPSGDVDPTFGTGGATTFALGASSETDHHEIRRLVATTDGALYLLGAKTDADGFGGMVLGKLDAAGAPDPSFGLAGFLPRPEGDLLAGIAVQSDGRLVAAGQRGTATRPVVPTPDLVGEVLVQRFLPSGTLDPSFGTGGETVFSLGRLDPPQDGALDVTLQGGRVLLSGFSTSATDYGLLWARLTADLLFRDGFESGSIAGWAAWAASTAP